MISLNSIKPVNIKLPIVYRYMEKQFVDNFFSNGLLRISSFDRFKEYPDEIRGDQSEGTGSFETVSVEGTQNILITDSGKNKYLMSSSLVYDKSLFETFDVDGCIRINDPIAFSNSIMNSILGSTECFLGFCNYQEYRHIKKVITSFSDKDDMADDGTLTIGGQNFNNRINETIGNGIDLLFLKEMKYQPQSEFRFVWAVNSDFFKINNYIDIDCKEAIQFCQRV